jgi:hypothetical protein
MLRETISRKVALIFADANSANNDPTTVRPAASAKAKYKRDRIVLSQESAANRLRTVPVLKSNRRAESGFVTVLPS